MLMLLDDALELLGYPPGAVAEDVSLDEAKARYRKLALLLHPDKNKDPRAKEAFETIKEAFEVVKNEVAVKIVDKEQEKLPALVVRVPVSTRTVVLGGLPPVSCLPVRCPRCTGTGASAPGDLLTCIQCGGSGGACPACAGRGRLFRGARRCRVCAGAGHVPGPPRAEIPHDIVDGQTIHDEKENVTVTFCMTVEDILEEEKEGDIRVTRIDTASGDVVLGLRLHLRHVLCGFRRAVALYGGAETLVLEAPGYRDPKAPWVFAGAGLPAAASSGSGKRRARGRVIVQVEEVVYPSSAEAATKLSMFKDVFVKILGGKN